MSLVCSLELAAKTKFLKFTGGPTGGTFQLFSNSLSVRLSEKLPGVRVSNQASAGSTENLRKINRGRVDFGVVHSGDLFLGRQGKLSGDNKSYQDVLAMAVLYRSAAQLVVLKKSDIRSLADLKGKRIGIGGPGSGAAATAERFFRSVGLWDSIDRQFLGYSKAASAMKDGHLDAMWVVSGFPTRAIIELAATKSVRLLDLQAEADKKGFLAAYPFYQAITIKAKTYEGVDHDVRVFADSTVWVAGRKTDDSYVYKTLKEVYSKDGLAYLQSVIPSSRYMSPSTGIQGLKVPLHPGAKKFWQEMGQELTKEQL